MLKGEELILNVCENTVISGVNGDVAHNVINTKCN